METIATRAAYRQPDREPCGAATAGRSPVEISAAPLKGGEGKDLGVIAVIRDLTVVRELENRLRRSDRLAALGSLAAGLAHEIKNPLTSLLTFSRHLHAALRRRAVPRQVPVGRAARAGAHQRHRRATARAGPAARA